MCEARRHTASRRHETFACLGEVPGREFPAHYRDIIEQYYRRLAAEESKDK